MAIKDTKVESWASDNDSNSPGDSEYVAKDLAAQFRNVKSAYRTFSFNKAYEIPPLEEYSPPAYYLDLLVAYYFVGNQLAMFQPNRKLLVRNSSGQILSGYVISASYTHGVSPYTTVTAAFIGTWSASYSELILGVDKTSPAVFPSSSMGGCVAFEGSTSSQVVSFAQVKENTAPSNANGFNLDRRYLLPVKNYHVHLSPCYKSVDSSQGSSVVFKVTKAFDKFTVQLFQAPGTDKTVIYDWFITFPSEGV